MRDALLDFPALVGSHIPVVLVVGAMRSVERNGAVMCLKFASGW